MGDTDDATRTAWIITLLAAACLTKSFCTAVQGNLQVPTELDTESESLTLTKSWTAAQRVRVGGCRCSGPGNQVQQYSFLPAAQFIIEFREEIRLWLTYLHRTPIPYSSKICTVKTWQVTQTPRMEGSALCSETMSRSNLKVTIHMHNKFVKKASAEERK